MGRQTGISPREPECGYAFSGITCTESGTHFCVPRAARVVYFFAERLTHTKGKWAGKAFKLRDWQVDDIIAPLFGMVRWSTELKRYIRKYRIAWISLSRKQGKSEILAGIALYMLVADNEQGAEIYGLARDREQARKVYDVAERMVKLSPQLERRLKVYTAAKRIVDEKTGSWYEILAADTLGNLGHNPYGTVLDEASAQRDGRLWSAMRTAMGTRDEPLMVAVGTAGDDPQSWAYREHLEMLRILEDPERAPHVFVHMRHTPAEADPWDEANWHYANPALGQFLSIESLRDEALEAKNDPSKENAWRQYRLNQWVNQASRWLQLHMWDECTGDIWPTPDWGRQQLAGRPCYAGFDLAAKFDLTAFCLAFPGEEADDTVHMLWRFWLPEAGLQRLDQLNGGVFSQWAAKGWLTVTDGDVIDYDRVISDIGQDAADFNIVAADCDEWSMWPIINRVAETCGLSPDSGQLSAYRNTYDRMTSGLEDLYGLVKGGRLVHHGNPVARFCADMTEIRRSRLDPNLIRPSKPERNVSRARIDAIPTAAMALNALRNHDDGGSAYDTNGLMVV